MKYGRDITHTLLDNSELAEISEEQRSARYAVWQTSLPNSDFSAPAIEDRPSRTGHRGPAMVEIITDPASHQRCPCSHTEEGPRD